MRRVVLAVIVSLATVLTAADAHARRCGDPCGGCSDPCAAFSDSGCDDCGPSVARNGLLDTGCVEELRVVLCPQYDVVKRSICCTEYKEEQRTRPVTVRKSVPVEEQKICVETFFVPKTETKTIEYTVSVPVQEEQTKTVTTTVPVWKEVTEEYTVKTPELVQVEETYTVKVPVVEEVPCEYTVMVPTATKQTVLRTVTNAVPVEKTKTVEHCVPVVKTKMVKRDCGRWQTQLVPVDGSGAECGGCGDGGAAATRTRCRAVWVPNIVYEEVTCVENQIETQEVKYLTYEQTCEQVSHECISICYCPEVRTGTKQVVKYVDEPRTRMRTEVRYRDEVRTRTKKVLSYEEQTRTETFPVIRYVPEVRTKEVCYTVKTPQQRTKTYTTTRFDCVEETKLEEYTIRVPVPVIKEVDVQICRMVPKVVSATVNPCECCKSGRRRCGRR